MSLLWSPQEPKHLVTEEEKEAFWDAALDVTFTIAAVWSIAMFMAIAKL